MQFRGDRMIVRRATPGELGDEETVGSDEDISDHPAQQGYVMKSVEKTYPSQLLLPIRSRQTVSEIISMPRIARDGPPLCGLESQPVADAIRDWWLYHVRRGHLQTANKPPIATILNDILGRGIHNTML